MEINRSFFQFSTEPPVYCPKRCG